MISLLERLRLAVACMILMGAIGFALASVAATPVAAAAIGKCEFDPDAGPCDPDKGYIWDTCYDDDGCYYELEECCEI